MNEHGHTLLEVVLVLVLMLVGASILIPGLRAYSQEAQITGAAHTFRGRFREAPAIALAKNVQTAIRFETGPAGAVYSIYVDGNHNGVLSADIASGRDRRLGPPV